MSVGSWWLILESFRFPFFAPLTRLASWWSIRETPLDSEETRALSKAALFGDGLLDRAFLIAR
jgi:hypothetical protein